MFFYVIEKDGSEVLINQAKISHVSISVSGEDIQLFWGEGENLCFCRLSNYQLQILKQALDLCVLEWSSPVIAYDGPQPF